MTDQGLQKTITEILDLPTAEMDDSLVLAPDGAGGIEARAEAGGASLTGNVIRATPIGIDHLTDDGNSTAAGQARACPIVIPGSMKLRSLWISVATNGSGSIQWGLFDYSSDATSCTPLAGGSAAPGGTGWRQIAAASAPVSITAGNYMLIVKQPDTNESTIDVTIQISGANNGIGAAQSSYTWDDTPTLASGWTADSRMFTCFLSGDLDGSATRWVSI